MVNSFHFITEVTAWPVGQFPCKQVFICSNNSVKYFITILFNPIVHQGIVEEVINIFPVNIIFKLLNPEVMYVCMVFGIAFG